MIFCFFNSHFENIRMQLKAGNIRVRDNLYCHDHVKE